MTRGISKGLKSGSPCPTVFCFDSRFDFTEYLAQNSSLHSDLLSAGGHESNSSNYSQKSQVACIPSRTEGVLGDRKDKVPYELTKRSVLKERPYPCDYCICDWGFTAMDGIHTCHDSCKEYQAWADGKIVIPFEFDEVREI